MDFLYTDFIKSRLNLNVTPKPTTSQYPEKTGSKTFKKSFNRIITILSVLKGTRITGLILVYLFNTTEQNVKIAAILCPGKTR